MDNTFPIALPDAAPGKIRPMDLAGLLRDIEALYIDAALAQTEGNRQAAANLLGLQRTTLVEKLRRRRRPDASSSSSSSSSSSPPSSAPPMSTAGANVESP